MVTAAITGPGAGQGRDQPFTGRWSGSKVPFSKLQDNQSAQCLQCREHPEACGPADQPQLLTATWVTIKVNRSNEAIANNQSFIQDFSGNALAPMKSRLEQAVCKNIPSNKLADNGEFQDSAGDTL